MFRIILALTLAVASIFLFVIDALDDRVDWTLGTWGSIIPWASTHTSVGFWNGDLGIFHRQDISRGSLPGGWIDKRYKLKGFRLRICGNDSQGWKYHFVRIPLWAPATLCAIYPGLILLRRWRSRRRCARGFCGSCGYNLTGNVSGTCPECGQLINARAARRVSEGRHAALVRGHADRH
jgi:hypothetical protein